MSLLYLSWGPNNTMRTLAPECGNHWIHLTWRFATASLFWILRKQNRLLYTLADRPAFLFLRFPLAAPQLISRSTRIDVVEIKGHGRSNMGFAGPGRGPRAWAL